MSWSGGTYTKGNNVSGGWVGDASVGIGIEAGRHDTQDNDFATGINTCLTKDGQNAATADLPMGGFKHTNVANATGRTNYAAVGQVQDGDYIWLGTTGGTATAQTATATPAITAYKAGQKFRVKIGAGLGSTGQVATSHTLNVNGIGAKDIVCNDGANSFPTLGTWVVGAIVELFYDGTYFQITNNPTGRLTWTPTITSAAGTVSGITIASNYYQKINKQIHFNLLGYFSLSGASTSTVYMTLPVRAAFVSQLAGNGYFVSGGPTVMGFCVTYSPTSTNQVYCSRYDSGTLAAGTIYFGFNGSYFSE